MRCGGWAWHYRRSGRPGGDACFVQAAGRRDGRPVREADDGAPVRGAMALGAQTLGVRWRSYGPTRCIAVARPCVATRWRLQGGAARWVWLRADVHLHMHMFASKRKELISLIHCLRVTGGQLQADGAEARPHADGVVA